MKVFRILYYNADLIRFMSIFAEVSDVALWPLVPGLFFFGFFFVFVTQRAKNVI